MEFFMIECPNQRKLTNQVANPSSPIRRSFMFLLTGRSSSSPNRHQKIHGKGVQETGATGATILVRTQARELLGTGSCMRGLPGHDNPGIGSRSHEHGYLRVVNEGQGSTSTRGGGLEVPKYPRRALHLSASEARFGGVG